MFTETQFLLSERNNPNSRKRDNGNRWWGYPTRRGTISCIVLHTTENNPGNGIAMNVARWQASTAPAPSSYHKLVDTHNIVQTVLDNQTAFHAVGFNSRGLGLSFATWASSWGRDRTTDARMLERGAWVAAQWCKRYNIPVRLITKAEGERGVKGFITHAAVDPGRRSDPGRNFPMERFFSLVRGYINGIKPAPEPEPEPEPMDEWEVFWMSLSEKDKVVLKEFAEVLQEEGTNATSFVRQLLKRHREDIPLLNHHVAQINKLTKLADTSLQGVVIGGVNAIDVLRDMGYEIDTTERTGPRRASPEGD